MSRRHRRPTLTRAPRDATVVLIGPATGHAPLGGAWTDVTAPWRTEGTHRLRRLDDGPLARLSSRVVGAVVCVDCDRAVLVLGPDPAVVDSIVESVAAGG